MSEQIRTLELSENMRRLDFSTHEQSKQMVNAAEAESGEKLGGIRQVSSKGGRGKAGGVSKAAAAIGVPRSTLRDAIKHVATAEQFPVFQRREWKQSAVLAVREELEKLPEPDRAAAVELVRRLVADDVETLDLLDQALQNEHGGARAGAGRPAEQRSDEIKVDNIHLDNSRSRPDGTSAARALRRLRSQRPDLHAQVLAGEMSPHAAAVKAGFRRRTASVPIDDMERLA